ncbi:MAG: biopolymer transporter ExbD [Mucispirillum sp.]|nr:biopolymer transporter ExbD [Mucispirillum sp.]
MRFRKEKKDTNIMINITSLIDVVFILLIFFAVTTSFVTPTSIKVDLPKAKGEQAEEKKNIRVAIDSAGALFLDGEPISDSGLAERFETLKSVNPEAVVIIEADEKSLHGKVVFVIDKARGADFTRFAIATEEGE